MRVVFIDRIIFLFVFFFFGCSKEKEQTVAVLQVQLGDKIEGIEWMEVNARRRDENSIAYIEALGFNTERFFLNLAGIRDTGIIGGLTLHHISYSDGSDLKLSHLVPGFIKITDRTSHSLSGIFEVVFEDHTVNANALKATGSFRIIGKE
jgi:hypothetical protein